MKLLMLFLISLLFSNVSVSNTKSFSAQSYIVMEESTCQILEGHNYHKIQSVASISKIMTAIIALEELNLNKKVYIDDFIDEAYGSAVYLKKNTWISNKDLIYGLMLRSGNDCALMIAKSVCDSLPRFVEKMNQKANELKMYDTTFNNPSGLDEEDDGNISSAHDMALLQSYALKNKMYIEITSTKYYQSESYGKWMNKNKLLHSYENTISGKTGVAPVFCEI